MKKQETNREKSLDIVRTGVEEKEGEESGAE
jgi:hypothetical protein